MGIQNLLPFIATYTEKISFSDLRGKVCGINGLLTGCEGHTEKYRTAVFVQPELARAVLKDQGPVFLSMARANPVNKPFII